ncbi:MAG TPA: hypothetical protein VH325_01250 [Bryobacteraceae bacterium]|jgi:hypothetical protein|nr:hypothetical protein [Bryobacteraceae bacterium]
MRIRTAALLALLSLVAGAWQIEPSAFHISIIDGEGALNNVQGRLAREPIVQVEDRNHRPVAGAYVVFDGPTSGPGAVFADGSTHFATTTGADGRAIASGLRNNGVTGNFDLKIHVSLQGQPIGELTIHQSNIPAKVAHISNNLQSSRTGQLANVAIPATVVGVALGSEFLINGAPTHGNANLLVGTRLKTGSTPVALSLHDHGEFVVGPNSTVLIGDSHLLTVESGAARGREFGNWKMGYGRVWLTGPGNNVDGVISISHNSIEVASINGTLQIVNAAGDVVGTVAPGTVSTFGIATAASGAGIAGTGLSATSVWLIGGGAAALLTGLGLAADVNTPPPPMSR